MIESWRALRRGRHVTKRVDAEAVRTLVKSRDLDRYWSTLFAPADNRLALLSVYAFHLEIERIPAVVTEPMLGQIRLQWWRDAVSNASHATKTGNPIADVLIQTIVACDLNKEDIFRAIDSRSDQVFGDKRQSLPELRGFLNDAEGSIFRLAAAVLGDRSHPAAGAFQDASELSGLMNIIRFPSLHRNLRDDFLALAGQKSMGTNGDVISAGESIAPGVDKLFAAAREARERLRISSRQLSQNARPAFLWLTLAGAYLKAAETQGAKPNADPVNVSPIRRFLILWRASQHRSLMI